MPPVDPVLRFWTKVRKTETCWYWTDAPLGNGYGSLGIGTTRISAHRFVYELLVGPIPDGFTIDHLCHTEAVMRGECAGGPTCPHRLCVNPVHLEAVTSGENTLRGVGAAKTHCPQGHLYVPENTYMYDNKRHCKTCRVQRNRLYRQKVSA